MIPIKFYFKGAFGLTFSSHKKRKTMELSACGYSMPYKAGKN